MDLRRVSVPVVVWVLGLGLSGLAAGAVARWERASYRVEFQRQADGLTTALQRSINRYTELLLALGDFYRVSDQGVSREGFRRFVQRALETYPGIQALEWAPVVESCDRNAFEAQVREEGYPGFGITRRESRGRLVPAPQPERCQGAAAHVPVTYLQPWAGNELAFGYDLTSDVTRRTALETARDSGGIAASGRIRLVQEQKNQFGFLVFLPLYDGEVPESRPQRRQQISGYLLGVFRVSDVVEESLKSLDTRIDVVLKDSSAAAAEQFLGLYQAASRGVTIEEVELAVPSDLCPTPEHCTRPLTSGDRQWTLTFAPAADYPAFTPWSALLVLVIGLLLSTLVARYIAQAQTEVARARELSDVKIRLFSMASHELRTPLSTILLSAQTLEAASPTNRQRAYSRIRAAAKRMAQLLQDLLTLSRAESGKLPFAPEIVDLVPFCQQLIEEVRESFQSCPPIALQGSGGTAYVDPQLLRSILTNLLSNAVKYSGGEPEVTLRLVQPPQHVVFEVQDRGIGISPADQRRLCEAFYRGTNVGDIGGTGLGLSVVQACLQLHHGRLSCRSQLDQGTTFTVTLPRID